MASTIRRSEQEKRKRSWRLGSNLSSREKTDGDQISRTSWCLGCPSPARRSVISHGQRYSHPWRHRAATTRTSSKDQTLKHKPLLLNTYVLTSKKTVVYLHTQGGEEKNPGRRETYHLKPPSCMIDSLSPDALSTSVINPSPNKWQAVSGGLPIVLYQRASTVKLVKN